MEALDRAEAARRAVVSGAATPLDLVRFLQDRDPLVRGTVSGLLFLRRGEGAGELPALAGLPEEHGETRLLRAELGEEAEACRIARADADGAIRSRAARRCVLARAADDGVLRRLAADPDWRVRTRLATALRELARRGETTPAEREVLVKLANDSHPTVAVAAAAGETGRGT